MIFLRLFKNNRSAGVIVVILAGTALFMKSFLTRGAVEPHTGMPLYRILFGAIHRYPLADHLLALLFMFLIGYMLFRINIQFFLIPFRTYMPATFFFLVTAVLPASHQMTPALAGSIFYLLCFALLFSSHDASPDSLGIFNTSLILGFGSLFYMKLIWFVPLFWIVLAVIRPVTLREILYPLITYFLFFLFLFTWFLVIRQDTSAFSSLLRENLVFHHARTDYHYSVYIYYGFILLLMLIASIHITTRFQTAKIIVRKIYQVLLFMFIYGIVFYLFISGDDQGAMVYIAIPLAFLLSHYFHRKRNPWTHELAFWILTGLIIYIQFTT